MKKIDDFKKSRAMGPILLLMAQYISKIMGPFISLFVVRYLGTEDYGLYASAIAITSFLLFLPDFGLQQAALKMSVNSRMKISELIKLTLYTSIIYSCITYIILFIWLTSFQYDNTIKIIAYMSGISFFRASFLMVMTTLLQIKQDYSRLAVNNLFINSSQWITTIFCILLNVDVLQLVIWPQFVSLLIAALLLLWEGKRFKVFKKITVSLVNKPIKELIGQSLEFGTAGSMFQLYHQSDAAILSAFRTPVEVGYYSVAFRITELVNFFPTVLFNQVLYPKFFEWSKTNREKYLKFYKLLNKIMILLGFFATSIILMFSNELTSIVFGSEEIISSTILCIMIIAIPFRFFSSSVGAILTTDNLIRKKIKIQSIIAIINVGLNFLLIPIHGGIAAALLIIVTDGLLMLGYLLTLNKYVTKSHISRKLLCQLPILVGIVVFSILFNHFELIYRFLAGIIIFIVISIILINNFDRDEIFEIKSLFKRK